MNEADTCREYVLPKLQQAGWDQTPHAIAEQQAITDGRILTLGQTVRRLARKRPDYLLRYAPNQTIAVVEAKRAGKTPATGLQQAKVYAEMLGLRFAYATNGHGIVEFDYGTGQQRTLEYFPSPTELWARLQGGATPTDPAIQAKLLTPYRVVPDKPARYYQEIAINRAFAAILRGQRRVLLTLATGTGKTLIAFQICWRLWQMRWNAKGEYRRPRILFLADRNVLIDDPKDKIFADFGDARHKLEGGVAIKSREMYFATYQALAQDERRPGLYREFAPDFFDLILVDECHRGSARDDSNWREILTYFTPAYQLGMTATPLRDDNRDTYTYFGNPLYTYSLAQGIADGFLAPYRVHRIISAVDAAGWRPYAGQRDRHGQEIPDAEYHTKDFERTVALQARTAAFARHLTDFLKRTSRFDKTIVFCVDQEHALAMQEALVNLNRDLTSQFPDYICRVTSDEGEIGRGHLSRFQDLEKDTPVILTTSKLLTTGVDAPTCKNVVIAQVVNSMTEFKQIIGRGTRVREDYDKLFFNIIDYTGSATRLFADPDFDGEPELATQVEIDAAGRVIDYSAGGEQEHSGIAETGAGEQYDQHTMPTTNSSAGQAHHQTGLPRKYYVDEGAVEIIRETVHELDASGRRLRTISYSEYAGNLVRTLYTDDGELLAQWRNPLQRQAILTTLRERGIDLDELRQVAQQPDADPLDLLCHLAFNAPLYTRRQRAERLQRNQQDFFDHYAPEARAILSAMVEKYTDYGLTQFAFPDILKVAPFADYGNVLEIAAHFGGLGELRAAVDELQALLYAA
ncbi:MAG: DEAD/DEAH box helicase family protein [Caldilineaceae bacterium]